VNKKRLTDLEKKCGNTARERNGIARRSRRFLAKTTDEEKLAMYEALMRFKGIPDPECPPYKYRNRGTFELSDILPQVQEERLRKNLEQLAEQILKPKEKGK
jgi:hypothetical protein